MGSGFAADSPCWYSCSFVLFVVQNSTDKEHGVHGGREGRKNGGTEADWFGFF